MDRSIGESVYQSAAHSLSPSSLLGAHAHLLVVVCLTCRVVLALGLSKLADAGVKGHAMVAGVTAAGLDGGVATVDGGVDLGAAEALE